MRLALDLGVQKPDCHRFDSNPPKETNKKKKNPNTPLLLKGAVRLGRHTVLID